MNFDTKFVIKNFLNGPWEQFADDLTLTNTRVAEFIQSATAKLARSMLDEVFNSFLTNIVIMIKIFPVIV